MNTNQIFDCFPYFNERELLEFRIKLLQDHVTGFIISEADHTFSGDPKPFTCEQTLKDMGLWSDKIQIIQCTLPPSDVKVDMWYRERVQRNALAQLFTPQGVYVVSDCDEIIDPHMLPLYVEGAVQYPNQIVRIQLAWLNAKANLRVCSPKGDSAPFAVAFMCLPHHVQQLTLSDIREDEACKHHAIPYPSLYMWDPQGALVDAGWHMSWLGGADRMKLKMRSYSHYQDGQVGIFETAVGAINSEQMLTYLDTYDPQPGSLDPYGRSDYFLKDYDVNRLPPLIHQLPHLKEYFFGAQS